MAGSSVYQESDLYASLSARIEGLKLLAHHVEEPVVIFNPQMELVYANPPAERLIGSCPLVHSPGEENSVVPSGQREHCECCHGKQMFKGIEQFPVTSDSLSASTARVNPACPLPRAVPLKGGEGTVHFAVLMGVQGRESMVLGSKNLAQPVSSGPKLRQGDKDSHKAIIGESAPIQRLVEMIQLVSASEATVLIQGESGTGKELVAKTIHFSSHRREHPFIVVECSALPETLLES